jgi:hypothetical protein
MRSLLGCRVREGRAKVEPQLPAVFDELLAVLAADLVFVSGCGENLADCLERRLTYGLWVESKQRGHDLSVGPSSLEVADVPAAEIASGCRCAVDQPKPV